LIALIGQMKVAERKELLDFAESLVGEAGKGKHGRSS